MCSQSEVMHGYEQIFFLTERMLDLSRSGQWGGLPALEAQYSQTAERLREIEPAMPLDNAQVERKRRLLKSVDEYQAEISSIVTPQLIKLGAILRTMELQQSLQSAYLAH